MEPTGFPDSLDVESERKEAQLLRYLAGGAANLGVQTASSGLYRVRSRCLGDIQVEMCRRQLDSGVWSSGERLSWGYTSGSSQDRDCI